MLGAGGCALVADDVGVLVGGAVLPLNLVLVALLHLATRDQLVQHALGAVLHLVLGGHLLSLLRADLASHLGQVLAILADRVTPADVLVGCLLQMLQAIKYYQSAHRNKKSTALHPSFYLGSAPICSWVGLSTKKADHH